jgi:hypothetical protein
VRRLTTGKIDGSLEPSSSLVALRALQAPAYVNIDYGFEGGEPSTGYKWMCWCASPRPKQEWSQVTRKNLCSSLQTACDYGAHPVA